MVAGDLDDGASLESALAGAWGVFSVQNTWEAGVEEEEEQGKRLAKLARDKGVERFVYTSVGSAHKATGIPHFENKFRIEQTVKALGFPSYAIVRQSSSWRTCCRPGAQRRQADDGPVTGVKLQMIASDDIGKFVAKAFAEAEQPKNLEVDIAGDAITMTEAATAVGPLLGKPITYQQVPIAGSASKARTWRG